MAAQPESFDPGQVWLGGGSGRDYKPYMMLGNPPTAQQSTPSPTSTSPVMGAEAVRASGSGPFDAAYRQNLATYAGGQFTRPGGSLTFDPTGDLFGEPTGGGNAPLPGIGKSLFEQALGGQPFSFTPAPDQTQVSPQSGASRPSDWRFWIKQFRENGRLFQ